MRERRIFSQDGKISLPFNRLELFVRDGEEKENAKIIAKCGPEEYCMWEGPANTARLEVRHATEYLQGFCHFSYRLGTITEKGKKKEKK